MGASNDVKGVHGAKKHCCIDLVGLAMRRTTELCYYVLSLLFLIHQSKYQKKYRIPEFGQQGNQIKGAGCSRSPSPSPQIDNSTEVQLLTRQQQLVQLVMSSFQFLPNITSLMKSYNGLPAAYQQVYFENWEYEIKELTPKSFSWVDIALFGAGGLDSKLIAPIAVEKGVAVVDNSSVFRMDLTMPLIILDVNADA